MTHQQSYSYIYIVVRILNTSESNYDSPTIVFIIISSHSFVYYIYQHPPLDLPQEMPEARE
jgi:hypothetical protein